MRNRAKCRLCGDIIESFHRYDYVLCKCEEIAIDGGHEISHMKCSALDWKNFIRIGDDDKEIEVKVIDKLYEETPSNEGAVPPKPTRADVIDALQRMIDSIENLPENAKLQPVNQYDLCAVLLLMQAFCAVN